MKTALFILHSSFFIFVCGCNCTRFEAIRPDGTFVRVTNQRFVWSTEKYAMSISSNTATLTATKANANADAMGAVAEGVAAGLAKGIKP